MNFSSLRWRIQLWYGLILVLVLSGFGITAFQIERVRELREIDEELRHAMTAVNQVIHDDRPPSRPGRGKGRRRHGNPPFAPPGPNPRSFIDHSLTIEASLGLLPTFSNEDSGLYFCLWSNAERGSIMSESAPDDLSRPAESERPEFQQFRSRDLWRELYITTPLGDCFLVGKSTQGARDALRAYAGKLNLAGFAVFLCGMAGGWWFTGKAMAPIAAISQASREIADGRLDARIRMVESKSELGRLAGLLNHTFSRLQAAFIRQQQFTADASHELRTPLSVMLTTTQNALRHTRTPEEYRESLQVCQRSVQHMRHVTESMLFLARPDEGTLQPVDLDRIILDSIDLIRPLAREKEVTLCEEIQSVRLVGNAIQLEQVVMNLITNAIHYNRPGGKVTVNLDSMRNWARLVVSDDGQGIPSADLPHVFERFYRVDRSRARGAGRTGLGLAIVKDVIERFDGSIEVESQPGQGSIFTVRLPLG